MRHSQITSRTAQNCNSLASLENEEACAPTDDSADCLNGDSHGGETSLGQKGSLGSPALDHPACQKEVERPYNFCVSWVLVTEALMVRIQVGGLPANVVDMAIKEYCWAVPPSISLVLHLSPLPSYGG
jgi:hypothetical protein